MSLGTLHSLGMPEGIPPMTPPKLIRPMSENAPKAFDEAWVQGKRGSDKLLTLKGEYSAFQISEPVFGALAIIVIGPSWWANQLVKKIFPKTESENIFQGSTGSCAMTEQASLMGGPQAVIWAKRLDFGVIAHEANHFALNLMDHIGMPTDKSTREFQCYMTQWVVGCVQEALNLTVDDFGDRCEQVDFHEA